MRIVATVGSSDAGKLCDASGCRNPYWPLFIPVVGPVATLATIAPASNEAAGDWIAALLITDTLLQASSLVAAVLGFVPRLTLVRDDAARLELAPLRLGTGWGAGLTGSF